MDGTRRFRGRSEPRCGCVLAPCPNPGASRRNSAVPSGLRDSDSLKAPLPRAFMETAPPRRMGTAFEEDDGDTSAASEARGERVVASSLPTGPGGDAPRTLRAKERGATSAARSKSVGLEGAAASRFFPFLGRKTRDPRRSRDVSTLCLL